MLASWVFALLLVCAVYALWNRRGLRLFLAARGARSGEGSPAAELPDHVLRTGPQPAPLFEGDALRLEVGLDTTGASRGPAWIGGDVAGTRLHAGTGVVPRAGWRVERSLEGLRRGPIGASGWTIVTSDPLG
ncbi:MAG TPA: hypothetical protein VKD46_00880, partial [bacterium]|nr:hypothetical protein [bacterium]